MATAAYCLAKAGQFRRRARAAAPRPPPLVAEYPPALAATEPPHRRLGLR